MYPTSCQNVSTSLLILKPKRIFSPVYSLMGKRETGINDISLQNNPSSTILINNCSTYQEAARF